MGRPMLRSVDREQAGRVIEPRNEVSCEGRHRVIWWKATSSWPGTSPRRPRRGLRAGHVGEGIPRNLGDPHVSSWYPDQADWEKGTARLSGAAFRAWESEEGTHEGYRGTKENEVKREGREGVGVPA